MKRNFALLLVLVLAFTFALSGCSAKTEEPAEVGEEETKTEEPVEVEEPADTLELAFATGGTSGTYYPLGGSIASVWNKHIDGVNVTIQPAGASVENINRVSSGQVDLVLAMNNIADQAFNGVGESFPEALDGFKAVGVVYPEVMHVITTQSTGIQSIAELKGKTINPGPPGSGTYVTAMAILEAYGIGEDDFKSRPGSFSDAVSGLKDGNLDAGFAVVSFPASAVTQIATTNPVKILEITGDGFDKLLESVPFAAQFAITGGAYNGQDEDATTVALQAVLYAKSDLSDELVYDLAKVMYENTPEITLGHARGAQILLENAANGITTPFHPGALKYLEEKGIK
jgi:TRAP transporter TAXI family solute receptor